MIRRIFNITIFIIFVFIQVFFVDNFDFKFGLIFIPLIYLYVKNSIEDFVIFGMVLFITYDFFVNTFVSYSLLAFLVSNFLIDQMAKLWGKDLLIIIKLYLVIFTFYIFNWGLLSASFLVNLAIITGFILIRRVVQGGYFRFN